MVFWAMHFIDSLFLQTVLKNLISIFAIIWSKLSPKYPFFTWHKGGILSLHKKSLLLETMGSKTLFFFDKVWKSFLFRKNWKRTKKLSPRWPQPQKSLSYKIYPPCHRSVVSGICDFEFWKILCLIFRKCPKENIDLPFGQT